MPRLAQKSLRVLQILRAPVGGLFRHVFDLAQVLSARGHKIGLVVGNTDTDAQTDVKLKALAPSLALGVHQFPMTRLLGASDLTTPFAIRRLAAELDIDVLHGHGAKGGLSARIARIGRNKRVALYTTHGGVLNYKPGSMASHVFHNLERLLLSQTDAIVFESAYVEAAYAEQIAPPACPCPVIHNGLTPADFEPYPVGNEPYDFSFVGEFRPVKGIEFMLDALVDVSAPDGRPATLIMGGGGPDLELINAQIARLGLSDRVRLNGVQPARDIFRKGRCALVPSLAESLPYVILEAAAGGRPVIATNVGGVREIFGPTAEKLIPASDTEALRVAMDEFMTAPDQAMDEMRQRLAYITETFPIEDMADSIEALYFEALASR